MPCCTTMSRLKCEGSFVGMCMNRLALRDVLKESIVLAAQMDGVNYRGREQQGERHHA